MPPARQSRNASLTAKGRERESEILEAARQLFVAEGYAGFSMRGIAARAGVTLGTVQHYYPSQDLLLAAVLDRMLAAIQRGADRVTEAETGSAVARFRGAMRFYIGWLREPANQAMFSELKALALRNPAAARAFAAVERAAHAAIRGHLRELAPGRGLEVRASIVLAQLMGQTYFAERSHDAAMIDQMIAAATVRSRTPTSRGPGTGGKRGTRQRNSARGGIGT